MAEGVKSQQQHIAINLAKHNSRKTRLRIGFLKIMIGAKYLECFHIFKKHSTHSRIIMVRKLILQFFFMV